MDDLSGPKSGASEFKATISVDGLKVKAGGEVGNVYPHLSYSIAPPYSVVAFVTHDPGQKLNQRTPVVSAQPYRAGDRAPH
jgi:hypothetical protein